MKMHNLATDCLLMLFNSKFSLQQLFHLRAICRQFCSVIESRYCIGRRRSLKIFWAFEEIQLYTSRLYNSTYEHIEVLKLKQIGDADNDDLIMNVTTFRQETCDWLARMFPAVCHLVVFFGPNTGIVYSTIPYLVTRWRTLMGVSLFGQFYPEQHDPEHGLASLLCNALNQLAPNLIHLDYCLDNLFDNEAQFNAGDVPSLINLPVTLDPGLVSRLGRFFFTHASKHFVNHVIRHLGPNCTTLAFDLIRLDRGELVQALTTRSQCSLVPSTVTSLRLSQDMDRISDICRQFIALRSLELHNSTREMELERLLPRLRPLTELTELKLVEFDFYVFDQEGYQPKCRLPVLDRITSLTIQPWFRSEKLPDRLSSPRPLFSAMAHTFPRLSKLKLLLAYPFTSAYNHLLNEGHKYLNRFPRLFHFVLYFGPRLHSEIFFNLMSSHHRARYSRESGRQWLTDRRIRLGFTGVQIWNRQVDSAGKISPKAKWKINEAQLRFYRKRNFINR